MLRVDVTAPASGGSVASGSGGGCDAGTGALALALLAGFSLGIPRKRTR